MKTTNVNDLIFPVEMVENTEFECNSDYSHDIFGYINGIKTRLNCCSDRYELVPNAEIFLPIRETLMENGFTIEEQYEIINNARFYADYTIKNMSVEVGNSGDVIFPVLKVQHSYNGLTKYKITFGFFRFICTNGLVVPVSGKEQFNLSVVGKHTAKLNQSIGKLFDKVNYFVDNSTQIVKPFQDFSGRSVENVGERIIEVLTANKITLVENKVFSTLNSIKETLGKEADMLNVKPNDWLIYNAINQYIFSDRTIASPEIRQANDQNVFQYMATHF